ncbi:MAG: methyl-accepting chemotaxis protein [Verrucomicrobiae bacterium]|nr:methyl-accepting chemotaxis protein [Verrucomicrobiae bacterium]
MKNLPITWRLNLGLAIFASLGLAGAILTWWIGKENEAARGRGIQQQLEFRDLVDRVEDHVHIRNRQLIRFLFDTGLPDPEASRPILGQRPESELIRNAIQTEPDHRRALDDFARTTLSPLHSAEELIHSAATKDMNRARTIYWGEYLSARSRFDNRIKELKTRSAGLKTRPHPALLTVETALSLVLALFAIWTVAMLRHNLVAFREPVHELRAALDQLARGDFSINVHLKRKDEFADIANGIINTTRGLALIVGRVHQHAAIVAKAARALIVSANQQHRAVEEIGSLAEFISEAGRNINYTATQLSGAVSIVGQAAEAAARLGQKGGNGIRGLAAAMSAIKDSSDGINNKLEVLNEKAANVGQVVVTMSKVADQTNLLSINAAIEAEKAGESGKGFGVVANEIQRLADQTAVAAEDIEQMVKEMRTAVAAGVIGTEQFGHDVDQGTDSLSNLETVMQGISRHIDSLHPQVEIVGTNMHVQADGARQLQVRGQKLTQAIKSAAESLHAIKAAVEQLESSAGQLEEGMTRLKFPD